MRPCRLYTIAEFEKFADDFARKRFRSAGQLPQQMVEVLHCRA